eukprot:COSAG05_NODE_21721_length_270_cov_0.216374_1_plen_55_part_10
MTRYCTAVLVRYDSTLLRTTLLKVPSQRRAVILADPSVCFFKQKTAYEILRSDWS